MLELASNDCSSFPMYLLLPIRAPDKIPGKLCWDLSLVIGLEDWEGDSGFYCSTEKLMWHHWTWGNPYSRTGRGNTLGVLWHHMCSLSQHPLECAFCAQSHIWMPSCLNQGADSWEAAKCKNKTKHLSERGLIVFLDCQHAIVVYH
jgi:hypothetical protein